MTDDLPPVDEPVENIAKIKPEVSSVTKLAVTIMKGTKNRMRREIQEGMC